MGAVSIPIVNFGCFTQFNREMTEVNDRLPVEKIEEAAGIRDTAGKVLLSRTIGE